MRAPKGNTLKAQCDRAHYRRLWLLDVPVLSYADDRVDSLLYAYNACFPDRLKGVYWESKEEMGMDIVKMYEEYRANN